MRICVAMGTASLVAGLLTTVPLAQQSVFRATAEGVLIDVSVKSGLHAVEGLTTADFEVLDNGVRQHVDVAPADGVPLDVTVLVDASILHDEVRDLPAAVRRMIAGLRPTDQVRVLACAPDVRELIPMQPASNVISVDGLVAVQFMHHVESLNGLLEAMVRVGSPSRRAVVVAFTELGGGAITIDVLPPIFRASDATLFIGLVPIREGWTPFGRLSLMSDLAAMTGGAILYTRVSYPLSAYPPPSARPDEVLSFSDLAKVFDRAISDVRLGYVLAYTPQGVTLKGWHDVTVHVVRRGRQKFVVRARSGYEG